MLIAARIRDHGRLGRSQYPAGRFVSSFVGGLHVWPILTQTGQVSETLLPGSTWASWFTGRRGRSCVEVVQDGPSRSAGLLQRHPEAVRRHTSIERETRRSRRGKEANEGRRCSCPVPGTVIHPLHGYSAK